MQPPRTQGAKETTAAASVTCCQDHLLAIGSAYTIEKLFEFRVIRGRERHAANRKVAPGFERPAFNAALDLVIGKPSLDRFAIRNVFDLCIRWQSNQNI